ncbi:MAG: phosphoribosylformylglycinamidine synthase subunit PurS [Thermotogae bacterium]|nr:phosphoribosylformylglycinamidine synthase subunit PurS [Thermotogota bacterium]
MRFKFRVIVMPKRDLLDPQGRAVERVLKDLGKPIHNVRIGKSVELEVEASTKEEARRMVEEVAGEILSNPIIENYTLVEL